MDKSSSDNCLTLVADSNSGRTDRENSQSPPASQSNVGPPSTANSLGVASVFTFNSTEEVSFEDDRFLVNRDKKSLPSTPTNADVEESVNDNENDASGTYVEDVDNNSFTDKKKYIKLEVQEEYTYVIRYDYPTLLKKIEEIKQWEEEQVTSSTSTNNKDIPTTAKLETLYEDKTLEKNLKDKLSTRMFRNIFSKMTSPVADRKISPSSVHYKKTKSRYSSSPSLTKSSGTGNNGKKNSAGVKIKKDGVTV
ncbi:hypothetical protein HELRODRAFT_169739 [Helobdella robusta]|uniref:Uncharacterized protein n=1 Tax=Helobdella robusta TaxID=6412 RepID=T1F2A4_HELRO|nr:hypothetical protein HELRODRAFT_169739 [Helobdella robusta]ESO08018.1 hypothetical protein HELRODRAFT_169739 [Helobdella robusta]